MTFINTTKVVQKCKCINIFVIFAIAIKCKENNIYYTQNSSIK
ncbi:hypothetical protein HMPREF1870_00011 [Bacteroidales bacterium KA00344]|nr:hypothetical protein HMPREF1870_00011 [Bacteroidales bacterium KA00344]